MSEQGAALPVVLILLSIPLLEKPYATHGLIQRNPGKRAKSLSVE
jgi:hypothetical protein